MSSDKVLDYLEKLVKSNDEVPYELTPDKVRERAEENEWQETDSEIFFAIKRHHPVFGSRNVPGVGMSSFVEFKYRYSFNKNTYNISQLDREFIRLKYNAYSVAENFIYTPDYSYYKIEVDFDGELKISTPYGASLKIKSLQEALGFAKETLLDMNYEFIFYEIEDYLSTDELKSIYLEFIQEVEAMFDTRVKQEITAKWDEVNEDY